MNMSFNNSYLGAPSTSSYIQLNTEEGKKEMANISEKSFKGIGSIEVKLPPSVNYNINNLNDISSNKENIEKGKKGLN
jgi:hypothetical protein